MKHLNIRYSSILILICLTFTSIVLGQNKTDAVSSIHFLSGEWQVENYAQDDVEWKKLGQTKAICQLEHDGKFVSERTTFLTQYGEINMITFIGFDSKANKFKLTAMDKEYGLMDIYLGGWMDDQLIFDNLQSDLPVKTQDGKDLYFRLTYKDISADHFTHLVEGTTDNGKNWFIFSKSNFNRLDKK